MGGVLGYPSLLCAVMLLIGCGSARTPQGTRTQCTSWKDDVAQIMKDNCGSCHSGPAPAGGLDTSDYLSVLGGGSQPVRSVAGDANSRLLSIIASDTTSDSHKRISDPVRDSLRTWIVDCSVSYVRSIYHQAGILNPEDPNGQFHGALLRQANYKLSACSGCHGQDLTGGEVKVSCLTCHPQGVTTCDTCHSRLPSAHRAHATGASLGRQIACTECHPKRVSWLDPGHVFNSDDTLRTSPPIIAFGSLASATPYAMYRTSPPLFDAGTKQCTNVYCHGAVLGDLNAANTTPTWTGPSTQAICGTCHGAPPASHDPSITRCVLCHNRTVDDAKHFVTGGLHVNGKSDAGDGKGQCSSCHGFGGSSPFQDLLRKTDTSLVSVGAHAAHVNASHKLSAPIACSECHRNDLQLLGSGNLHKAFGQGVTIFPASLAAQLSNREGASPKWDRAAAKCSSTYCHGSGSKLLTDTSTTVNRNPIWNAENQASCGSCHGIPPKDANHTATMRLVDCVTCHAKTMDASGAILFSGPPGAQTTTHLNGVADGN